MELKSRSCGLQQPALPPLPPERPARTPALRLGRARPRADLEKMTLFARARGSGCFVIAAAMAAVVVLGVGDDGGPSAQLRSRKHCCKTC